MEVFALRSCPMISERSKAVRVRNQAVRDWSLSFLRQKSWVWIFGGEGSGASLCLVAHVSARQALVTKNSRISTFPRQCFHTDPCFAELSYLIMPTFSMILINPSLSLMVSNLDKVSLSWNRPINVCSIFN